MGASVGRLAGRTGGMKRLIDRKKLIQNIIWIIISVHRTYARTVPNFQFCTGQLMPVRHTHGPYGHTDNSSVVWIETSFLAVEIAVNIPNYARSQWGSLNRKNSDSFQEQNEWKKRETNVTCYFLHFFRKSIIFNYFHYYCLLRSSTLLILVSS